MHTHERADRNAMTDAPSLVSNPLALVKAGVTLVVVSSVILWVVISRRPEPPPDSLSELERVVGTVESVSENFRPLSTTKIGRRRVVHERARQGLVLGLKTSADERSEWAIEEWLIDEPSEAPKLRNELTPGTSVTAYARDGLIFQLESPRGVLVDLGRARASRGLSGAGALALLVLTLVAGVVLCGRAAMLWLRKGDDALPGR
jgi:hypothetical protein